MIRLTPDGPINDIDLAGQSCCPASLCDLDVCSMICNFVNLLPSGPLWDEQKARVLERYSTDCHGISCPPTPDDCTSLVAHSIYVAKRTYSTLVNGLWPVLRESNPKTAYSTMDDWLARLGWVDCFNSACRSPALGEITPYELPGECGNYFCVPEGPEDLLCAVKHGIILALTRLQMGIIRNLDGINFVLEPLGAELQPVINACTYEDGVTACPIEFSIVNIPGLERCCESQCVDSEEYIDCKDNELLPYYEPVDGCTQVAGYPQRIYPGLLAAECIARSLLAQDGSVKINRIC